MSVPEVRRGPATGARGGPGLPGIGAAVLGAAALGGVMGLGASLPPLLLIGVPLTLAVVSAILARPDWAVPLALFLLFINAPVVAIRDHGAPVPVGLAVPFLLCIPLARDAVQGRRPIADPVLGGLVILAMVAGASTAVSDHQGQALTALITFVIEGPVLYLLGLNAARRPQTLRWAALALVAAGSFMASATVVQAVIGGFDRPLWGFAPLDSTYFSGHADTPRAGGPVGDPNYFAQLLLPLLAMALVLALRGRPRGIRPVCAGAGIVMLFAIGYTSSRGAAIALAALVLAAVALRILRARHLLPLAAVAVVLLAAVPGYRDRIGSLAVSGITAKSGQADEADSSTRSRATESLAASLAYRDHPVLGVGPGVFPLYYQRYAARVGIEVQESTRTGAEAGQAPTRAAHDLLVGVAADLGSLGLLVFCGITLVALGRLTLARRRLLEDGRDELADIAGALLAGLLAYLAAGIFLSLAYERFFWMLLALAGAASAVANEDSSTRTLRRYHARSARRGTRSLGLAPSARQNTISTTTPPTL